MRLENKMSAKVDQTFAVEPHSLKMSATPASTASTSGGPKVSKFATKSGFVIPKNRLVGSLVPVSRGGKKPGGDDAAKEETTKQVERKTKWGPDLTQDAAVRKGRALAYQTRVDQITQQLKSGILEVGDNQDSPLAAQHADHKSSTPQVDSEKSELLELERREAIGEILKLNPSYKAPSDYKPLLKEARVPIPVKEHQRYNFVGLIFGPGSETQKRLEKETGAQITFYGTKASTGEKGEVSQSDGNEIHAAYEELHVHVSADTYEKVDAAVALIELLFTSVSDNLAAGSTPTSVSGDNVNALSQGQDAAIPYLVPTAVVNQGVAQSAVRPTQTPSQGQFQYQGPWFQAGPPQNPMRPPGFIPPPNTPALILNNPVHAQSSPFNPSNMPSLFGPRPAPAARFNSNFQSQSLGPTRALPPIQVLSNPYMPQIHPLGHAARPSNSSLLGPLPSLAQPNNSAPFPFTGGQPPPTGPAPMARPLMPSLPQHVPSGPTQGPCLAVPQPAVASSAAPSNISAANTFPFPAVSASLHPTAMSVPAPSPTPIQSSSPITPPSLQSGIPNLVSGNMANFTPMRPPTVTTSRSQHPSYGDFTFQRHPPPHSVSQTVPRSISQPLTQNTPPPRPIVQPPASQAPPFRLAVTNSTPQPHMHVYPGPQVGNQMGQHQAHISSPFAGNPTAISVPPRLPAFANTSQMGPRNFSPANDMPNVAGPFPPRPGNPKQNWPENLMGPNQQFSSGLPIASSMTSSSHSGRQQIYDPFSPTSVSIAPQQQGGNMARIRKQDNDPEYDDLMASVGVIM